MLTEAGDGKGRSLAKLFAVQAVQPGRRQTAHVDGVRQVPLRASSHRERAHAAAKARSETWDPDFQYYYLPLSAVTPVSTSLPRQDRTNTWHGALQSIFGRPSHGSCGLIPIPCSLYSACRCECTCGLTVRGNVSVEFGRSPARGYEGLGGGDLHHCIVTSRLCQPTFGPNIAAAANQCHARCWAEGQARHGNASSRLVLEDDDSLHAHERRLGGGDLHRKSG